MPGTARLSKRFHEVLGEDVANELVEWLNAVDATYRAELRDLNERNLLVVRTCRGDPRQPSLARSPRDCVEVPKRLAQYSNDKIGVGK